MRYIVTIGGRAVTVQVTGDGVVVNGRARPATLIPVPHTPIRHLTLDGRSATVALVRGDEGWTVGVRGETLAADVIDERTKALRDMTGKSGAPGSGGAVKAPMPGLVLRLEVAVGDTVTAGQGLVVLEAMKMENEIKAGVAGVVSAIRVAAGQAVDKGAVLIELDPAT